MIFPIQLKLSLIISSFLSFFNIKINDDTNLKIILIGISVDNIVKILCKILTAITLIFKSDS